MVERRTTRSEFWVHFSLECGREKRRDGGERAEADFSTSTSLLNSRLDRGDIIADMQEDDSPYDEVRVSVSNLDDPDMPSTYTVSLSLSLCEGTSSRLTSLLSASLLSSPHLPSLGHRNDSLPPHQRSQHLPLLPKFSSGHSFHPRSVGCSSLRVSPANFPFAETPLLSAFFQPSRLPNGKDSRLGSPHHGLQTAS